MMFSYVYPCRGMFHTLNSQVLLEDASQSTRTNARLGFRGSVKADCPRNVPSKRCQLPDLLQTLESVF